MNLNSITSTPSTLGKRPADSQIEDNAPNKRQKNSSSEAISPIEQRIKEQSQNYFINFLTWGNQTLNPDAISVILSFLPPLDLARFSVITNRARYYTESHYANLLIKERFNLEWSDCKNHESYPQRARYLLGKTLQRYIRCQSYLNLVENKSEASLSFSKKIKIIYEKFQFFMERFPSLGAFISQDLNTIVPLETLGRKIFEWKKPQELKTGDQLLEILSNLSLLFERVEEEEEKSPPPPAIEIVDLSARVWYRLDSTCYTLPPNSLQGSLLSLKKIIEPSTTYVSYLVIKMLQSRFRGEERAKEYSQQLIQFSVQHHDYRASDAFLRVSKMENFLPKMTEEEQEIFPSILVEKARNEINTDLNEYSDDDELEERYKQANKWIEAAIESYGTSVPPDVWLDAAIIKYELGQVKEAQKYLDKAIEEFQEDVPSYVWRIAGTIKWEEGQLEEAEKYFDCERAKNKENEEIQGYNCDYFHRATTLVYESSITADINPLKAWKYAAQVKIKLGKFAEAEECLHYYLENIPLTDTDMEFIPILEEWIRIKEKLGKNREEAIQFLFQRIDHALLLAEEENSSISISLEVLEYGFKEKVKLGDWREALSYCNQPISTDLWIDTIQMWINLGELQKAQKCIRGAMDYFRKVIV